MGHVVNPVAWRLNFTKYWINLHSEKRDSNYLNFSDYVFLISLKRLLTKRIFYRYKLVFDRLTFIHRYWQDLLLLKFKYSKYSKKSNKRSNIRLGFLHRTKNHKETSWKASRSFFGIFARLNLRIGFCSSFDFANMMKTLFKVNFVKKPFSISESSYLSEIYTFPTKFFRWYDKPILTYKVTEYFFKFLTFKKNLNFFWNKKFVLVSNFNYKQFPYSNKRSNFFENFFLKKNKNFQKCINFLDVSLFKYHFLRHKFLNYPKKSLKKFYLVFLSKKGTLFSNIFKKKIKKIKKIHKYVWLFLKKRKYRSRLRKRDKFVKQSDYRNFRLLTDIRNSSRRNAVNKMKKKLNFSKKKKPLVRRLSARRRKLFISFKWRKQRKNRKKLSKKKFKLKFKTVVAVKIKRRRPTLGEKKALRKRYFEMYPLKKLEIRIKRRKSLMPKKTRFFIKKNLFKTRNYFSFVPNLKKELNLEIMKKYFINKNNALISNYYSDRKPYFKLSFKDYLFFSNKDLIKTRMKYFDVEKYSKNLKKRIKTIVSKKKSSKKHVKKNMLQKKYFKKKFIGRRSIIFSKIYFLKKNNLLYDHYSKKYYNRQLQKTYSYPFIKFKKDLKFLCNNTIVFEKAVPPIKFIKWPYKLKDFFFLDYYDNLYRKNYYLNRKTKKSLRYNSYPEDRFDAESAHYAKKYFPFKFKFYKLKLEIFKRRKKLNKNRKRRILRFFKTSYLQKLKKIRLRYHILKRFLRRTYKISYWFKRNKNFKKKFNIFKTIFFSKDALKKRNFFFTDKQRKITFIDFFKKNNFLKIYNNFFFKRIIICDPKLRLRTYNRKAKKKPKPVFFSFWTALEKKTAPVEILPKKKIKRIKIFPKKKYFFSIFRKKILKKLFKKLNFSSFCKNKVPKIQNIDNFFEKKIKTFIMYRNFLKYKKIMKIFSTSFFYKNKIFSLKGFYNKLIKSLSALYFKSFKVYFTKSFLFKKNFYSSLFNARIRNINLNQTYLTDLHIFNKKIICPENFIFSKDIFIISKRELMASPEFLSNKNISWFSFIWNFYFSVKTAFYTRYFTKFFKKIYKLKLVVLNFISNFYFINNVKVHLFIFKKRFVPSVNAFLNFFFFRIKGVKVKYQIKRTLRLLEKYFRYKIFSGFKFCLSGRYSRKDRAEFNWKKDGLLPLTDRLSPIYYGFYFNSFKYGAVNVKFWILLKSVKRITRSSIYLSSIISKKF